MELQEIEKKVREFLVNDFEIDEQKVQADARLREDIGIDSLDFVDIIVIVNREFGFRIVPEELQQVQTVQQFCEYIARKVNGAEG